MKKKKKTNFVRIIFLFIFIFFFSHFYLNSKQTNKQQDWTTQDPGTIYAMTFGRPGGNEKLYFGGEFNFLGKGTQANNLAYWDGENFVQAASGFDAPVRTLLYDPVGIRLFVGGQFRNGDFSGSASLGIYSYNGPSWTAVTAADGADGDTYATALSPLGVYAGGCYSWTFLLLTIQGPIQKRDYGM